MSEFPPPSGKPVAYALRGDPWAEQARRHELHRGEQRRHRRRVLLGVTGAAFVVAVASGVAFLLVGTDNASDGAADVPLSGIGSTAAVDISPEESVIATVATVATVATPISNGGDGEQAAKVVDVWLLDRGDGSFDWGAVLSSNADTVRGDLEVSVAALDADGREIFADQVAVPQLAPNGRAAVGGAFDAAGQIPARVEVTATLGAVLPDETGVVLAVSDVRRVASGQVDRDDRLLGTVEMVAGSEVPVRLAALWRDDEGRVVASVFDVLEPVDIAAAVEFSLRLPRNLVPPGEPDTIVASVGATD